MSVAPRQLAVLRAIESDPRHEFSDDDQAPIGSCLRAGLILEPRHFLDMWQLTPAGFAALREAP